MTSWQIVLDWLPWLGFVGLMLGMVAWQRAGLGRYRDEHIAEMRRQNEQLERIARVLEQRPPN